jgi:hypothetical protein
VYSTAHHLLNVVFFFTYSLTRWAGHVARMGEKRNAYMILVGKATLVYIGNPSDLYFWHIWFESLEGS